VPEFFTSDGVRLQYETRGAGRPVYALQAGPANSYRYLLDDLARLESEFTLVFHDYRGSGQSASAPPESYTFDRLARDLAELRAHLGHGRITLVAHSMGGLVALAYALGEPGFCERMVLVGTTPTAVSKKLVRPMLGALGITRTLKVLSRAGWYVVAWRRRRDAAARRRAAYAINETVHDAVIARDEALGLPLDNDNLGPLQRQLRRVDYTPELRRIRCPVLLLYGARDVAGAVGSELFKRGLAQYETVVISGVGHQPFFEAPSDSIDAVTRFLSPTPNT
jgi:pimeloyl-ACP methyl ester carboxylesterase